MVISVPCTSGIKPRWIPYAMQQGFDGVFIAADGDECAYLPDCTARTARIMTDAQALLTRKASIPARADGRDLLGLRRAVHQVHA